LQQTAEGSKTMETGTALPVFLFLAVVLAVAAVLLAMASLLNPKRPGLVKQMPYESGMDPIHDTRRRFDIRFYLVAIAFLVFDVELLFLYPWAVAVHPAPASVPGAESAEQAPAAAITWPAEIRDLIFAGAMVFIALLALGFVYDWRKGVFRWR
jgi:NADH-quinone oxidoreductase subunit A